jgi:hypothetical protein
VRDAVTLFPPPAHRRRNLFRRQAADRQRDGLVHRQQLDGNTPRGGDVRVNQIGVHVNWRAAHAIGLRATARWLRQNDPAVRLQAGRARRHEHVVRQRRARGVGAAQVAHDFLHALAPRRIKATARKTLNVHNLHAPLRKVLFDALITAAPHCQAQKRGHAALKITMQTLRQWRFDVRRFASKNTVSDKILNHLRVPSLRHPKHHNVTQWICRRFGIVPRNRHHRRVQQVNEIRVATPC